MTARRLSADDIHDALAGMGIACWHEERPQGEWVCEDLLTCLAPAMADHDELVEGAWRGVAGALVRHLEHAVHDLVEDWGAEGPRMNYRLAGEAMANARRMLRR